MPLLWQHNVLFKCVHICMISMATNEIIIKYANVLRLVWILVESVKEQILSQTEAGKWCQKSLQGNQTRK